MKTASLVFFYFGEESHLKALAQETVKIEKAFEGYDHKVLLKFKNLDLGPFLVGNKVAESVDVLLTPTQDHLMSEINRLGAEGYTTDLYIFSHGFGPSFRSSKGEYGQNTPITAKELLQGISTPNLRLVWQCNCYGSTLNPTWIQLGAKASTGARFNNFFPTRWNGFIERWNAGKTLEIALEESDTNYIRTPTHLFILADALQRKNEWGSCSFPQTVLGSSKCAEDYFKKCWLGDDWQNGKSGKANLNFASQMLISGDKNLTKS